MRILFLFLLSTFLSSETFSQNLNISNGLAFEGEPYIVIDPNDNQHLVVAWMGFKFGQEIIIKTRTTFDGGLTWSTTAELTHQQAGYGSADPSLQIDNIGNVYLCYIDYDNDNFTGGEILVTKSTDGGLSWTNPVIAISTTDCPNKLCIDRPWMILDNSGGVLDGTLYVTSMNANQPTIVNPPYNPYLAVSSDDGSSFTTPRFLDTLGYYSGSLISAAMPTPTVGADGTFYAIYPSYETSQSVFAQYIMAQSDDAGASLSHNVTHQAASGLSSQLAKKAPLLISNPSDPSHLAYLFLKEDNGDMDVYYSESLDFGSNWTSLIRVNDDPVGNGIMQDLIWADFNEVDDVVVCWRDRRNGGAGYDVPTEIMGAVLFSDSTDFSSNFTITDQSVNHEAVLEGAGNDFMSVQFSGDTIHAVWGDTRSGELNIYYNRMNVKDQTVSIQSIAKSNWNFLNVFPNPAQEFIVLDNKLTDHDFTIINHQGRLVKSGTLSNKATVDIKNLSMGQYFIYLSNGDSIATFKFVKN
jgi:hypothetical protein